MAKLQKNRTYLIRAGILSVSFLSFIPLVGLARGDDDEAEASMQAPAVAPTTGDTQTSPSRPSTRPQSTTPSTTPQQQAQPTTPQQPAAPSNTQRTHTRSRGS